MNAIRADEELDNIHSLYVDQWDWELVIGEENRSVEYLKEVVKNISLMKRTEFFSTIATRSWKYAYLKN